MEQLIKFLEKIGVDAKAISLFRDAYKLLPFATDQERSGWAAMWVEALTELSKRHPAHDVKGFVERYAAVIDSRVLEDAGAIEKSKNEFIDFMAARKAT